MYEDEIMESGLQKKNNALSCDWKETFTDVLLMITLVIFGVAVGIGLCKFWPEFWWFINWGARG